MNFTDIIDINSDEQKQNLLSFMHSKFSDEHQRMFIKSFYMTLFETEDKYPITDDEAIKWLGFTRKDNFKRFLEKHLILDTHYVSILRVEDQNPKPCENIRFTVDAFKILGMKAGTKEGDCIRMYYIELEKQIFAYGMWQSSQKLKEKELENVNLQQQNEKLIEENNTLNVKNGTPVIYIYDTDSRNQNSDKKIGITEHYRSRMKPYKQVTPFGKMVFKIEISPNYNLKIVEQWIHYLLKKFRLEGEVFNVSIDEAKTIITKVVNLLNLIELEDSTERQSKLAKLLDYETQVIHDIPNPKLSSREMSTQTDYIEDTKSIVLDTNKSKFDQYIDECCIIDENNEVSTVDIIGQYRLWSKTADKDTYHALLDYLTIKFRPTRLNLQDKSSVVNGFRGVCLKEIEYKRKFVNNQSDPETFIFHMCNFTPSGKVLMPELVDEYIAWKKRLNKPLNKNDVLDFKKYMKDCEYVLVSNIWCPNGSGQGYYGINLKSAEILHKKTSSTAKKVEKRDIKTNTTLDTWTTIAKAAEAEGISAAKMSRSIKNNIKFNDYYYVIANT